jgi:phenylalanyl-tRNA synthetase beta chain
VCGYYGGVQFDTITIGPAPDWMVKRLQAAGVRSINNVVDITNYVMLEWGQPLHAFDAACLGAGVLGVRRAAEGETLTTLDDVARPLTPEAVCITHNNQPVAMAGVMGGQSTEITPESKTLFLEGAWFPAATTRRSARSVGLRSDAAARYERGVDHATTRQCLLYATQLLQQFAQAQPVALVRGWHTNR